MIIPGERMGRLFRLPLWERRTNVRGPFQKEELICINGKGTFFKYDCEEELVPANIQRFRGSIICKTFCIVEATDALKAVQKFHEEWDGAMIGGPGRTDKALWIDEAAVIIGYPVCRRVRQNPTGRYVCGCLEIDDPKDPDCNGEFGGCFLDGLDPLESCPLVGWKGIKKQVEYGGVVYKVLLAPQSSLDEFV